MSVRLVVAVWGAVFAAHAAFAAETEAASPEPSAPQAEPAPNGDAPKPAQKPAVETLLTLQMAQGLAVKDSPTIDAAEARIAQAIERVKQARSTWFPTIFAEAAASNTWISESDYDFAKRAASDGYWTSFALGTQARLQGEIAAFAQIVGTNIASVFNPAVQPVSWLVPNSDRAIVQDLVKASLYSSNARDAVKDQFEAYTISIVADWIVFNGFDRKFSILEARYGKEQTEAALAEAHRILLEAVAQAYFSAQLARENIAIAEADEAFNELQLKQANLRKEVGTGSRSDVLNFQVRVNAARAALISARQSYATSLIALAELLALPDAKFPETMDLAPLEEASLNALEPPDSDGLVAYAKEHRPDLQVSALDVERANAVVGRAKSAFYPTIRAQVSKDGVRDNNPEFGIDDFSTTVGVFGTYELFAGGRNVARVRETKALRAEAEHLARETELNVASEVRTSVEDLREAQELIVLERANAVYVKDNRDLVEKGYQGGVEPLVRLNEAQRDLVQAQANLAFARVQLQASWHRVRTNTGETVASLGVTEKADEKPEAEVKTAEPK
ncbi:MAG: TolC family protein [Candidatus Hydrogenedentes bacterium]|nr:TolC family protein [Candidatus Hydrogenedentota bacterium]